MASSRMLALLGLLAVAGYQNRDKLGNLLSGLTGQGGTAPPNGMSPGAGSPAGMPPAANANSSLGGLLGGLLGANAMGGGGLPGALSEIVGQFSANGHGDTARSWVETGANRPVGPDQLEQALGEDTIKQLSMTTGLDRDELLARLTTVLPTAVDKMTPDGRLPSTDEAARWAQRAS